MEENKVTLTGGFYTRLAYHVKESLDNHPLWSSRFLVNKEASVAAYKDCIRAGSEIIVANSYQANKDVLMKHLNLTESEAKQLLIEGINYCREAVKQEKHPDNVKVKIGGSVGSYGACLNYGSEYTGSYCDSVSEENLKDWHRWRLTTTIEAGVDLVCFETIPSLKEALVLLDLLKEFPNQKAWLSFSIRNEREISTGENFAEVAEKCWEVGKHQLIAIGANCCNPKYISPLLDSLKNKNKSIPFIAYPNSGEKFDESTKQWVEDNNKGKLAKFVTEWLSKGITVVGGCCRSTLDDVAVMRSTIGSWKKEEID